MIILKIKLKEKILKVNKVSKSSKGFSCIGYSVLSVVGDNNGGIGLGKARGKDQSSGTFKSLLKAKSNFFKIPLKNGTIHHEIMGKHGATKVLLFPNRIGYGLLAGGCTRFIFYVMGIKSIICKIHGSSNAYNVSRATINALLNLTTPLIISKKRNLDLKNIIY